MTAILVAKGLFPAAAVLMLCVLLVGRASGQEKPNPIAVMVKASLKDPTQPFTLLVRFQAKEGAEDKLEAAFAKAIKLTRSEKGCLAYDLNRDVKMPTHYVLYERWQNLASLEAHLQSAHIAALFIELSESRAAPAEAQILLPVAQ